MLQAIILAAEIVLAAMVGYLLLLTAAALFAPRRTPPRAGPPTSRFAIIVPAHNEARLLPQLLESLRALDYPRELFAVHVVADNCSDDTAELGRAGGAVVHERVDTQHIGKGYALQWLLERLWAQGLAYDGALFLDADSLVSPNLLRVMDARLARGERAIQAYYAVRDPGRVWSISLRSVALMLLHYLRPQGRMVLGGSAGLKGNGMVFVDDVLRRYRWPAALTEDLEYHMLLILGGERVTFAPDAVVWAEMPGSLAAAQSQNARWERGRLEAVRAHVPRLLAAAARRRSFLLFDAAMEQIIPPFAILAAASLACLAAAAALGSPVGVGLGLAILAGQAAYTLAGLALARAPRRVYAALLYAPAFILWKVALYARLLLGIKPKSWVRTARNDV